MWRSRLVSRVCVLILATVPIWATAPEKDPDAQAQLQRIVEAVVGSTGDAAARADRLAETVPSRDALLIQIALFLRDADGTEDAMTGALVLQHLAFTDEEKVAAILPHLETEDADLRKVLYDLLGTVDRPDGGAPDFERYVPRLAGDSPPAGLVRYLYTVSPKEALGAMREANPVTAVPTVDVEAVETVLRHRRPGGALDVDELLGAVAAIERLSSSAVWWVRLYAASAIVRDPALADPEVRERLAGDAHPMVRTFVTQ